MARRKKEEETRKRDWSASKYNWLVDWVRELEAGTAWHAKRHEHFTCEPQSFAGIVYRVAADRGLKATVVVFPNTGVVVFAFYQADSFLRPNLNAYPVIRKMRKRG